MTDKTLTLATALAGASVANTDEVWIWDVSAGQLKKTTRAELIGGAYVLTVPATGVASLINVAQEITAAKTFNDTYLDLCRATALINMRAVVAGALLGQLYNSALIFYSRDLGATAGCNVNLGRNSNASTPGAAYIQMRGRGDGPNYLWPDASGNLRINTTEPVYASDTAGTVVGTQTSSLDAKAIIGDPISINDVLAAIHIGASAVRRFVYKDGSFNNEEFSGIVTDFAPRYGMDRDQEHPSGKTLNLITIVGDLLMAVANLTDRVRELERQA